VIHRISWFLLASLLIVIALSEAINNAIGWALFTIFVAGLCTSNGMHNED
jgi:hypothetical protein